ncbi:MAG: hypothetical protein H6730_24290 [Deltaproteobacteria bacterium]|nr:hypothetical protein [Deltaproteobacteria bacterium]
MRRLLAICLFGALGVGVTGVAQARDLADCQESWSKAVRSYLTQNRRAGPDGRTPANVDEEELVAQAWQQAFGPACKLEAQGSKAEARVEAALLGVQILSKLDPRGCSRFMEYYMGSTRAKDVCDMVAGGAGTAEVRASIEGSIPAR